MFFAASNILWFFLQPSSLIALVLLAGTGLSFRPGRERLGRALASTGVILLLIGGLSPLANAVLMPLENRVQPIGMSGSLQIDGIVLLGGFENGRVSKGRSSLAVNESAERLTETIILARRFPRARIVFTGGAENLLREQISAGPGIATYLRQAGIDAARLVLDERSRNTYDNAVRAYAVAKPAKGERWLLVTSAFHMPRALGCFRKAGFDVLAWPVDYRTKDAGDLLRLFSSISSGLRRLDLGAREWAGLAVYWLTGRTDAFFPR